ncbi:MAG TPA: LLM class flavin-dependent oxidoreductase [Roseiflexaceae bacterium]|nr:LLM class flavin-dependent oxidoreductase [Roseiflexaceae bacterium]
MNRAFRFGVVNEQPLAPTQWRAHVRRMEVLGYATFLIRDHVVPDYFGPQYAPLAAMMAAAAASERLRVGTLGLDNDYRHPAILAKEAATIDLLSGGRLELGLGAGWLQREYELAGIPFDHAGERIERLAEALPIIKGLLRGEAVMSQGQHYQIDGLENFPRPQQRPQASACAARTRRS